MLERVEPIAATGATATVPAAPEPRNAVTVAVLNASTTTGVARAAADRLVRAGYTPGTVTNARRPRRLSLVLYAPGARPAALAIARRERIARVAPLNAAVRAQVGGTADVVVIIGLLDAQRRP